MMKKIMAATLLAGLALTTAACAPNGTESAAGGTAAALSEDGKGMEGRIDYDNQQEWEFSAGRMQSPIDIPTADAKKMTSDAGVIKLSYGTAIKKAENNGHGIQVSDSGEAVINGRHFKLAQFHFHAQSEHTVDGKHYPLEAHFVNTAEVGRIAVIAVFFEEGKTNKGFQEVLDDVNSGVADPVTDIDEMVPADKSYYHYLGSLTTPPLNENVEWYVMKNPVQASKEQIESFKKLYFHNNREIQPLNDRIILEHDE